MSNTYDQSVLVLGVASVFCALKFAFCVFIVLIRVQMLIFHCSAVIMRTRLLSALYSTWSVVTSQITIRSPFCGYEMS